MTKILYALLIKELVAFDQDIVRALSTGKQSANIDKAVSVSHVHSTLT